MLLRILGLALLYLAFVGQPTWQEAAAALIGAALFAGFSLAQRQTAPQPFRFSLPPLHAAVSLLGALGRETATVGLALLRAVIGRPVRGEVTTQPFEPGGPDARDAARRALVILGLSLAPNGFVLDDTGEAEGLPLHRLAPQPVAADRRWPL
ncbi:hypothetical protein [Roseomonas elaeocarpi]|uniref:Sodium:proton antiporter n=1 Tax=Roseomonas elaeocarpi TaxID=907779 RepID=A0ABV6JXG5_9PROT